MALLTSHLHLQYFHVLTSKKAANAEAKQQTMLRTTTRSWTSDQITLQAHRKGHLTSSHT